MIGDPEINVSGVSEIQSSSPGTITFLGNPKYKKYIIEDNVKYQMVRVGNREFKLKVAGQDMLNEYIADSKLTTKQFYKKYPK